MKYLVDTDWVVDHLQGVERVGMRLEELGLEGLALSVISLAELYEGVLYSRDPTSSEEGLRLFMAPELIILGIDEETCRIFGRERGRLRREGRIIGDMDLLIGATALRHGLTLLTNNRRHFQALVGLEIVSVYDQ